MPKPEGTVRPALLAGQWYPDDPATCEREIATYAAGAEPAPGRRGLIGPHAGWLYSGTAAGHGYATLAAGCGDIDLVVVFGSHRPARGPNTVFRGNAWETPLGSLENARSLADALAEAMELEDEPVLPLHPDNAVELHLPFVRRFFPKAQLLMAGVAPAEVAIEIGTKAGELVRHAERKAVFIGSTDLTHYGPNYGFIPQGTGEAAVAWVRDVNDRGFIDRVVAGDGARVLEHGEAEASACCPGAVAATLAALTSYGHALAPRVLQHYLSYDIHPNSSFVGYASIVL